jgi:arsenite methyltransferase
LLCESHPPHDAREYARVLEDPQRDAWQLPHDVMMALDCKPREVVADIGAGTGYFARRIARHAAKVYAVDIDAEMLEIAKKNSPANVETVLATADDPTLPDASVNTIFFCDVLHHIENRAAYYPKLAKALKPGGRIVDIDFHKKPTPFGPPEAMRISEDSVIQEFQAAGFRKTKSFDLLPYQYFLVFQSQ